MEKKHRGKMAYVLQSISVIPLILFGLAILMLSLRLTTNAMYREIEQELSGTVKGFETTLDLLYPGDYHLDGEVSLHLYKGEHDLTREYGLVDAFKESSDCEITLFYKDTCILTTILDRYDARIVGKGASNIVIRDVLEHGSSSFYPNTMVFDTKYFCYYIPIKNSDDTTVGMLMAAKPSDHVNNEIRAVSYPLLIMVFVAALLISVCIHLYTRKFDLVLQHIRTFLSHVAKGNLTAELDPTVLRRNDEFGDIGRSAVQMQQSIRHTVETDALTELYNRRSGERKLTQIMDRAKSKENPFCVCIGDIDFFKKVNDTYGHAGGDIVLRAVSDLLRDHMNSIGFAARWGGEEFLLVFDRMSLAEAEKSLWELLDKIHDLKISYQSQVIQVTMTFGLVSGDAGDRDTLLLLADNKLYEGKSGGRDRVII